MLGGDFALVPDEKKITWIFAPLIEWQRRDWRRLGYGPIALDCEAPNAHSLLLLPREQ